jgi:hypothetical protein
MLSGLRYLTEARGGGVAGALGAMAAYALIAGLIGWVVGDALARRR